MTLHIAIIGGGASGTLLAAHLLDKGRSARALRVTLIEKRANPGRGLAYSTHQACHLLNVRAQNMSAFPDDPDHFLRWLAQQGSPASDADQVVPRNVFGRYLTELLTGSPDQTRLRIVEGECVGLSPHGNGVEVQLSDGSVIAAHHAVLATGYCRNSSTDTTLENPWSGASALDPSKSVVLIGTGLTMVDMVLSLLDAGQTGVIHAISRRGLMPQPHAPSRPLKLSVADMPIGASLAYSTRVLRDIIRRHQESGGDWRDVIDGLRPHTQTLWRHLPLDSRRRFLRHASTVWDVHRHRMPPCSAERIARAQETGVLHTIRGRFHDTERSGEGVTVRYRAPGADTLTRLTAARVIDCRGFPRFTASSENRLIHSLIERKTARPDPLCLGLDFDAESALVDGEGESSGIISGIGPITRGTFWEITAVPDIRVQAAHLAARLLSNEPRQRTTQRLHT